MLGSIAAEAARRFGDDPLYVADGWNLSYADFDRLGDEVAVGLAAHGVGESDVVALVLPQIPEFFVLYLAAGRLGAITAGVNARLTPSERAAVLDAAAASVVVTTAELATGAPGEIVVEPAGAAADVLGSLRTAGAGPPPHLADDPERPVALVFTSGTTGVPKGAVFAGRQLAFITDVDTGWRWADRGTGGTGFAATSFAHLGPMTKLPGNLTRGGRTFLLPRWRADETLHLLAEHHMTSVAGIPTQVALLLREPDFDAYDLSAVRAIVMGGGPATPALVREARARFAAPVSIRYSCTEAGIGIGTALDAAPEDAEVSVGRPHAGVDLALRDPDDPDSPVAAGAEGEVCLRSPAVMSEYWRRPDLTAAAFTADGFVRTGDLGWLDDEGRLHLVGRSKEMYVRGGYNVHPMEVEAVLAQHPAVAEIAIAARPDDVMGEVGVAFVVVRAGEPAPTVAALKAFAGDRLAAFKLPESLVVVDRLPVTAMEKLDRRALATRAAAPPTPST
jgi:acyl-CoA synthetase (AMP-forming)/AMP-acid ligase II